MEQDTIEMKKGDRIWVQVYNMYGSPSHFRLAEVLKTTQLLGYNGILRYVAVHYLDGGNTNYECVSLDRIKDLCESKTE